MKSAFILLFSVFFLVSSTGSDSTVKDFSSDVFETSEGELEISFIGHGTLMIRFNELIIHIDPVMREADYSEMPDADLVLVTHHHGDHLDKKAIQHIRKSKCPVVLTPTCHEQLGDFGEVVIMENGDTRTFSGILVEAIPAYNVQHKRSDGTPFHPKGIGNAYILTLGEKRILIGGDTENIPEIKSLQNIDIAFLPMNLPYTMSPEMVADAARAFRPKVLYPYHFGSTNTGRLVDLLEDEKEIEVRIRDF
jgi:L-ascorbate metabolism protein UlaG (beta-lactamase superfamily)